MEKDNNANNQKEKQDDKIEEKKKVFRLDKKTTIKSLNKKNSSRESKIKFNHPIKHYSSLQGLNKASDFIKSYLDSTLIINKENAFGYRILFEAFHENIQKKNKSISKENQDDNHLCKDNITQRKNSDIVLKKKRSSTFSKKDFDLAVTKLGNNSEIKSEKKDLIVNKKICKTSRERDDKAKNELVEYIKNIQIENKKKIKEDILIEDFHKNIDALDNLNNELLLRSSIKKDEIITNKSAMKFIDETKEKKQERKDEKIINDNNNINSFNSIEDENSIDELDESLSDDCDNYDKNSEEIIYENKIPVDFNSLIMGKIFGYKMEMLNFLDKARYEVEKLYDDLYMKIADIANRKAIRISQLYNRNFPFHHSNSDDINQKLHFDLNLNDNLSFKNSVSQSFKFESNLKHFDNLYDKENIIDKIKNSNLAFSDISTIKFEQEDQINEKLNIGSKVFNQEKTIDNDYFQEETKEKEIGKIKDFASKNLIAKIRSMFDLQESLKLTLTQNFELIKNLLSQYDLNNNNPLQEYIDFNAKEICDSWLLPKINFENLNMTCFINNKEIPSSFKNFILNEDSKNKFTSFFIERTKNTKNFEFERKILKNNHSFLTKLELISLESKGDLKRVFYEDQINKLNFDKMQKIKFEKSKLDNINYLFFFPNLSHLSFNNCRFIDMPSHFSVNFNKLKEISFKSCYLNNDNVKFLMNEFQSLSNIETINFGSNCITNFSFIPNSPFKKLHTLILRKNKISKLNINKEIIAKYYPKLEFLDLYSNNLCSLSNLESENFDKYKDNQAIILLGKNLILKSQANLENKYAKYLISTLGNSNANIGSLDLSYNFYKFKNENDLKIQNLKINMNIQISLRKLNLSFNNLTDSDLYFFFNENKGLMNLNKIKLNNNKFTEKILEIFFKMNSQNLFEYLKTIDLSGNNLDISSLECLRKVIDDNKNLKNIVIKNNPLINHIELFLNNKVSPLNRYCLKSFFDHIEEITKKHKRRLKIKYY